MPRVLPGDTKRQPKKPEDAGSGGKGISHVNPPPHRSEQEIRREAAVEINRRISSFSSDTVQKHPRTVASLVKSSLPTEKLVQMSDKVDKAWNYILERNTAYAALHDPDQPLGGTFDPFVPTEESVSAQQSQQNRAVQDARDAAGLSLAQRAAQSGYDISVDHGGPVPGALISFADSTPINIETGAAASQFPITKILQAGGWTLDNLGLHGVRQAVDETLNITGKAAAVAGRGLVGDPVAAAGFAVDELLPNPENVDTDWGALLDFWRLEKHDPVTTAWANLMGYNVDDPAFAETAQSLDIAAGLVEQVVLMKGVVKAVEFAKTPAVMGGMLKARTFAEHDILNGHYFDKAAKLFENSTEETRPARLLQSARRTPVRLAQALAEAYRVGETPEGKIALMKRTFADYIEKRAEDVQAHLNDVNAKLEVKPNDTSLRLERARTENLLEDIASKDPIEQWPRFQDVRGAVKGSPATTRFGKFIQGIYADTPVKSVVNVEKFVNNLRNRFKVYDWADPEAPADALRQNAQNVTRLMKDAGIPEESVSTTMSKMGDPNYSFHEWWTEATNKIADAATKWADPATVKQIRSTLTNDEMFTSRGSAKVTLVDENGDPVIGRGGEPIQVRRPLLKDTNGQSYPTQENEVSGGATAPDLNTVREVTKRTAQVRNSNAAFRLSKKAFDQAMAGWRATVIAVRGPGINLAIQAEEAFTSFFTGEHLRFGRRTVDWVLTKLPVSPEAQLKLARALGFEDVHEARAVYKQLKKTPEQLGQMMGDISLESAKRIEVPSERFNTDFRNGALDPKSKMVQENFADLVWEIEHTAGSGSMRTLLSRGPERTANLMLGTAEGAKSLDLERWYKTQLRRGIEADPNYVGTPQEQLVQFLTDKRAQLAELAGNNPDVLELMKTGRTKGMRLQDAPGEADLLQHEVEQIDARLAEGDIPEPIRRTLIDRRDTILNRADGLDDPKKLRISKNNKAIRNWLIDEAQNGNYELPETRRTLVTKSGYADFGEAHRGFLARWTAAQYSMMKYMNTDLVRAGFTESKFIKWRERYIKAGWTKENASKAAAAQAAYEARDWLHDIGNKSSFQRYLRNEVPFLHAWERVAYRWTVKIPNLLGAGFTPLGWGIESNIVHGLEDLLRQVGVIKTVQLPNGDTRNSTVIPNPLAMLNWLPGFDAPSHVDFFNPTTLLFPPRHLLSELPGLSPSAVFALDKLADWTHNETFKKLHDEFTRDGAFQFQFPGSGFATKVWEAVTGDVPPWAIGNSKNYQEYVVGRAHDAALRYAYTDMTQEGNEPPNRADFDTKAQYADARDDYWRELKARADEYFHGISWTYLAAAISPLTSFKPTTGEETAWRDFLAKNGITGERDQHDYQLINDYLAEHPESLAFNVSMYDKRSKWPEDAGLAEFRAAVGRGDVKVETFQDYIGKVQLAKEWEYKNEADHLALQRAGLGNWEQLGAKQQLLRWGDYQDALAESWANFSDFLDENPDAKRMYDRFSTPYQKVNDRIQEVRANRYNLEGRGIDVEARLNHLYDQRAGLTEYGTTKAEHVRWYKNKVMNDYYNTIDPINQRIAELKTSGLPNAPALLSAEYTKLREVQNSYPEIKGPDGKTYPAPEAYVYASQSADARKEQKQYWASLPPGYLSAFSYETTYGKTDARTKQYFTQSSAVWRVFSAKTNKMSHQSHEYDQWVKWRETSLDILAKRANAQDIRALEKAPDIVRQAAAGLTPQNDTMRWVLNHAQMIYNRGYAFSSSDDAQFYRHWLGQYIHLIRDPKSNLYDRAVDKYFTRRAKETGITFEQALYREVLFGNEGTYTIVFDLSKENKPYEEPK